MIKNRQKTIYRVFLSLTVIFTALLFVIVAYFDSFDDWAAPALFLCFFFDIVCVVCVIIFRKRSREIEKALENVDFIAQWHFSAGEWTQFMEKEDSFRTAQRKGVFFLLSVITVIIFMMFVIFAPEGNLAMFLVMLGLIAMYAMAAFIVPWLVQQFRKNTDAEVLILKTGVLLNKQFHSWDFPMSKLAKASYEKKPYEHLEIIYDFFDRTGPRSYTINVPIPKGEDPQSVIDELKKANEL